MQSSHIRRHLHARAVATCRTPLRRVGAQQRCPGRPASPRGHHHGRPHRPQHRRLRRSFVPRHRHGTWQLQRSRRSWTARTWSISRRGSSSSSSGTRPWGLLSRARAFRFRPRVRHASVAGVCTARLETQCLLEAGEWCRPFCVLRGPARPSVLLVEMSSVGPSAHGTLMRFRRRTRTMRSST